MACCCEPPPPPPPPPQGYPYYGYYLTSSTGCSCENCWDRIAPCRWQIEVTGFANGPSSGSCTTSTNCANNNGTFILSQDTSTAECEWRSPEFETSIIQPMSAPIYAYCVDLRNAYWRFRIYGASGGFVRVELWLIDSLNSYWQARYDALVAADSNSRIDCMVEKFTLTLNDNYIGAGSQPCCCHGAPATIDVVRI